jgi:hypothetical protein
MPKKNRNRRNIDVDPKLSKLIEDLSAEYGVPQSQLYNLFAAKGLIEHFKGRLSIRGRLKLSKSPAYLHNLDIEDLLKHLPDILDD